jgi:hypothetical protein
VALLSHRADTPEPRRIHKVTRYDDDKRSVRYEATVLVATVNEWL